MYTRCCALCVSCYACRAATTAALVSAFGYGSTAAIATSFELRELLALCLKRIRGLKSLSRISDCRWLYSEPHSNKLLLRLTARADVLEGKAEVEQSFNVSGLVHNMQCDECKQVSSPKQAHKDLQDYTECSVLVSTPSPPSSSFSLS